MIVLTNRKIVLYLQIKPYFIYNQPFLTMAKKQQLPPIYKLMGWLISLLAFTVGFWHTHLGLKEFNILNSENGSLFVAAMILLIMLLSYAVAIGGKRIGLLFYLICACIFFICNLNSFYPNYLGRTLLKEEAKAVNDSMTVYRSRLDKIVGLTSSEYYQKVQDLRNIRANLIREIHDRGGFGPHATDELNKFNILANSRISADRRLGRDSVEIKNKVDFYTKQLNAAIDDYVVKSLSGKEQGALKLVEAQHDMEDIIAMYDDKMEAILKDNARVKLDSVRTNPEIKTLEELVTKLDKVAIDVNSVKQPPPFILFNRDNEPVRPQIQFLGTIPHTMSSVGARIGKVDTLGVIMICLVIDFVAPLAVYFLIRRRTDEEEEISFWEALFGKNKNFNH